LAREKRGKVEKRERGKRRGKVAHMWTPLPRIVHISETTLQKS